MCFYWIPIETPNLNELTLAEMTTLAKSMKPFPSLLIGGGEPFIRKDLGEVIGTFVIHNNVNHVSIPTNGWYKDRVFRVMDNVCRSHPETYFNIDLSVEGPAELHDEIVQKIGAHKRLFETHDALIELRRQHKNLGLGAVFTMSRDNQHHWKETLPAMVEEYDFENIVITKTRGKPKDLSTRDVDTQNYRDACAYLEKCAKDGKLPGFKGLMGKIVQGKDVVMHDTIAAIAEGGGYQFPCQAAKLSVVISENGKVFACELLEKELADLRQYDMDFQRVWNNPEIEDMRNFIRDTNCHCTHECFTTINILANPRLFPKVLLESGKTLWS